MPSAIIVSARRSPRGYIIPAREARYVLTVQSAYEASKNCEVMEGWRPMGFNLHFGSLHSTKRAAAEELLSNHMFRCLPPKDIEEEIILMRSDSMAQDRMMYPCELCGSSKQHSHRAPTSQQLKAVKDIVRRIAAPIWAAFDKKQKRKK